MNELLASDADRERVAERLRAAAGEGRLTPEELEERLESAFSARTDAELEPLVADLPAPRPGTSAARPQHERAYVATMLLLVAIWALTGAGYFWPIWPMLGWGIGVVADAAVGCAARAVADLPTRAPRRAGSLVTGGGSGLGRATALELAALGAQVVVCGRRLEPLEETAAAARAAASRRAPATSARRTRSRRSSTACWSATARSTCS